MPSYYGCEKQKKTTIHATHGETRFIYKSMEILTVKKVNGVYKIFNKIILKFDIRLHTYQTPIVGNDGPQS